MHCRFGNALVAGGACDDLLAGVCRQIEGHGLKLRAAEAPDGEATVGPDIRFSADPDARWIKTGGKSTLGCKASRAPPRNASTRSSRNAGSVSSSALAP